MNHSRQNQRYKASSRRRLSIESLETRHVLSANVVISEFLASNDGPQLDGDGDSEDWIELFNADSSDVDLGGYYLTDDILEQTKWQFPAGTVVPHGTTLLVFASDKDDSGPAGELHTNFKLKSGGEYLGLIEPDGVTVVHDFAPEFPSQKTGISYGLSIDSSNLTLVDASHPMSYIVPSSGAFDATWNTIAFDDDGWATGTAGVGYETSPGGNTSYSPLLGISPELPSNTTSAYTRFEFSLSDVATLSSLQLEMIYDDGFVAYLNGQLIESQNAPINTPSWNSVASGSRSDSTVLADFVTFDIADHLDVLVNGENVLAIHALNRSSSSDMLMIPRLTTAGMSQLVEPIVEGYFDTPTPDAPNGELFSGFVADTKFSVDRGFYSAPIDVAISTDTPGAMIVYTTDGSEPSADGELNVTNGELYTDPLNISATTNLRAAAFKQSFRPTNIDTHTYVFTADVITQTRQSTLNAGFPSSWGGRSSDYGLDPDVIGPNDDFRGRYAGQIEDSLLAIPSISLTLDNDDFFGTNGIYANPSGSGVTWERATSAELIFPSGEEGFQIDAGLRIHGGASRNLSKKNALRLLFKSEYGETKLDYPLFGDEGVDRFDTIVLRPHFNDGWGWGGAEDDPLFIRDQWFRNTQAAMGHASSRGNVMHLYVNGLYWGLYNPSERPDDSFAAEIQGGDKSEYDVVNQNGLHKGSINAYNAMIDLTEDIQSNRNNVQRNQLYQQLQGNLPDGTDDPSREALLDVTNYIDYMLLNHYGGNNDWPNRNWFASRRQGLESDGFRFYAWDSEISLALSSRTSVTENNLNQSSGAAEAWSNLRDYNEFRLEFADRIHAHLFNGGALYVNPTNAAYDPLNPQDNVPASRFDQLADTVYESIVAESARWGDQHASTPRTRDLDWENELSYMLGTYFRDRHNIVLNQWRSAGIYPATIAPEFTVDQSRQHGGIFNAGSLLGIENANNTGTIYYTTDGTDPRLLGGTINTASAQVFNGEFSLLEDRTHLKARVLRNGEWSALSEATFTAPYDADFDASGTVDAADFTIWRDNLGNIGAGADGDANYDYAVDETDYEIWKSQFGTVTPVSVAAGANNIADFGDPQTSPNATAKKTPRQSLPVRQWPASDADSLASSANPPSSFTALNTPKRNAKFDKNAKTAATDPVDASQTLAASVKTDLDLFFANSRWKSAANRSSGLSVNQIHDCSESVEYQVPELFDAALADLDDVLGVS